MRSLMTIGAIASFLLLGACGQPPKLAERNNNRHTPMCGRDPKLCIGGYVIVTDPPHPYAYKVTAGEEGSENTVPVTTVDDFVKCEDGICLARFYWPDDQDKNGEVWYQKYLKTGSWREAR